MSDETYKTLLDAAIEERAKELSADASEAFENLAITLLMMPYDLSVDEIDAGMTDGSGDGQVDAMFVVVNGAALSGEETDELPEKGPLEIDIVLIQSKKSDSFAENPVKSIRGTVNDLLDLNQPYSTLEGEKWQRVVPRRRIRPRHLWWPLVRRDHSLALLRSRAPWSVCLRCYQTMRSKL